MDFGGSGEVIRNVGTPEERSEGALGIGGNVEGFEGWRKAQKKPVVVEFREAVPGEAVETREGTLVAQKDDYIIRGVQGEIYPIGREIFEQTYEVVGE